MPTVFTSKSQRIGELGETVAVRFLVASGYRIIERNYTRPCGEIDIVAEKGRKLLFIEVKSQTTASANAGRTGRPEENMHARKAMRIRRTIRTYLGERRVSSLQAWQFDLAVVILDMERRVGSVRVIQNLIL